jgi:hypothetical protein
MKTEKLFVLCAGHDYEGEQLIGVFDSSDACVDHVKSGNAIGGDYHCIYECELGKPPKTYPACPIFTITVVRTKRGTKVKVKKGRG